MFWTRFGAELFQDGLDHASVLSIAEGRGCWPFS